MKRDKLKKMGRPNILGEKPVRIAIRLDQADFEKVEAYAEANDMSLSKAIRSLIAGLAKPKRRKRRT